MAVEISELANMDATAQASLVRRRELSPLELVDAAIARIERINPALNAVITPLFEEARAAAASRGLPDGPFRGVPFLFKDVGATQRGLPYYMGNRALRDARYRSPADTPLGARFRAAGFVTLGKTNLPEFGAQTTTQPLAFGATHNPWNLDRSTSGSSGGSCAAVASGMVPVAHANDGGGSIRLPAAWCGLVGLKPSRGRICLPIVDRRKVEFVVTRTLRDAATVLDAVHGPEPGDLYLVAPPARSFRAELGADSGQLRIGIWAPHGIHPECLAATTSTASLLESLGHRVEESFPEAMLDPDQIPRTLPLHKPKGRRMMEDLGAMLGRPATQEDVEPHFWSQLSFMNEPSVKAEEFMAAMEWENEWAMRVARWWAGGFDLLLTPTVWEPAATLAEMTPINGKPWKLTKRISFHCLFTLAFNVTGQPAISLPMHWTPDGLPVGIQLVAAIGREDLLIRVASQLEQARPWIDRMPPVHA